MPRPVIIILTGGHYQRGAIIIQQPLERAIHLQQERYRFLAERYHFVAAGAELGRFVTANGGPCHADPLLSCGFHIVLALRMEDCTKSVPGIAATGKPLLYLMFYINYPNQNCDSLLP
ncbi:MAG: hypothetical protein U1F68_17340 [Gammaproteobacteria bacterium]